MKKTYDKLTSALGQFHEAFKGRNWRDFYDLASDFESYLLNEMIPNIAQRGNIHYFACSFGDREILVKFDHPNDVMTVTEVFDNGRHKRINQSRYYGNGQSEHRDVNRKPDNFDALVKRLADVDV